MYIERVPNRSSPPAILLRESYREGGKVKKRTLANLTHWPAEKVETLRAALKSTAGVPLAGQGFQIVRALPHGHVAAVLGMLRKLGLERLMDRTPSRVRDLCTALVAARVLEPASKLATSRALSPRTAGNSLGSTLGLGEVDCEELYEALDWLGARQERIEQSLARRHLAEGTLLLYDLSSTWFEGRHCPLAQRGYSRDGRRGTLQIVFGLLCDAEGCPVAVEVFSGNTADPKTLASQIDKLKVRFALARVVLVGDRGMITQARIEQELQPAGLDWISALRAPAIKQLAAAGGLLQLSLFDRTGLAEISSPDYPRERLIVCKNPLLACERARKRSELLAATQAGLDKIVAATRRAKRQLRGKDAIALKVGRVLDRYKMAKHFVLDIGEAAFSFRRDEPAIAAEAALDGIYVIRSSLPAGALSATDTVLAYKGLSSVERAFRSLKTVDLHVRPIRHRLEGRVRAHVFCCMLAYHVQWHLRRALAPLLFDDEDRPAAAALRSSPVAPAMRSSSARAKARTRRGPEGLPLHSFQTLLADLATLTRNQIRPSAPDAPDFPQLTLPTALQQRAFDLLGLRPGL